MGKSGNKENSDRAIFIILLITFILTEIIDLILDSLLGTQLLHSLLQVILFIMLFIVTYSLYKKYSQKKVKELIPEELMNILILIRASESKKILLNQRKIIKTLGITKPTAKKRLKILEELGYVEFKEDGNNKYLILTLTGKSIIS